MKRLVTVAALGLAVATVQYAGEARHLTLSEAVHMAIEQSRLLKIARLKVSESEARKAGARSAYFPSLKDESNILHVTDLQNISIPAGAFGNVGGALVPSRGTSALPRHNPSARTRHVLYERHPTLSAANTTRQNSCRKSDRRDGRRHFTRRIKKE